MLFAGFSAAAVAAPEEGTASTSGTTRVAKGLGMVKGAEDPPMRPHDQYPPWLQDLTEMEPSLGQLSRADLKSLSQQEVHRHSQHHSPDLVASSDLVCALPEVVIAHQTPSDFS